jgi:hypothetical protein
LRWKGSRTAAWLVTALGALACGSGKLADITIVSHPGGYGGAPASAESTCSPLTDPATLAVDGASRELSWTLCHFDAPNLYTLRTGQRVVTEAELEPVQAALDRLTPGMPEGMCGPDGGVLTLDVRAEASTELYISNSSCPPDWSAGRTPATGISDLWLKVQDLSGE